MSTIERPPPPRSSISHFSLSRTNQNGGHDHEADESGSNQKRLFCRLRLMNFAPQTNRCWLQTPEVAISLHWKATKTVAIRHFYISRSLRRLLYRSSVRMRRRLHFKGILPARGLVFCERNFFTRKFVYTKIVTPWYKSFATPQSY